MTRFDYVIVGAGPAGCVLASRLSADRAVEVLLIEAGGPDTHPLIAIPGAFPRLMSDPATTWQYSTQPFGRSRQVERWARGKTLGGSSSINGMLYHRGSRADYDALARVGNPGWGWDDLLPIFKEIESNELGWPGVRGTGGAHVLTTDGTELLLEDVITAGTELGWARATDLNETDEERIGYPMMTIHNGERVSAATAFLHPVMARANLTVMVDTTVDQVVVEGGRATGVRGRRNGRAVECHAAREVVLAAGSIATPRILQLSGIGPADTLRAAGIKAVVNSPNVGRRMREHRMFRLQFRLVEDVGYNRLLGTADGRRAAAEMYRRDRRGPLAAPSFDIVGFFKTHPALSRPDAQFQVAAFSMRRLADPGALPEIERAPGMWCVAYALRPTSQGRVHVTSGDPDAPLAIDPNYYATESDRTAAVAVFRGIRRLFTTKPLSRWIERETVPGPEVRTDQDVVDLGMEAGLCGFHAIGTCAMGPNDDDVVDPRLRVRGVANLRVVDASVLPTMVSGNTTGPVAALAWRAADFIIDGA